MTDILLGSSLLWETEQKDQQEEEVCFHDIILLMNKQHTQSNTPTSNVEICNIQVQKKEESNFLFCFLQKKVVLYYFFSRKKGKSYLFLLS